MTRSSHRQRLAQLESDGAPFVEATVVRAQRPTSVQPGDSALILPDGTIEGFVGGVCTEDGVRTHALAVLERNEPLLLRVLPGNAYEATLEPDSQEGAVTVTNPCLSGGGVEIFLQPHQVPAVIVVIGDTPVARSLVDVGHAIGVTVHRYDRTEQALPLPAGTRAVVAASHGRGELEVLTEALRAEIPYIGLVASKRRGESVLAAMTMQGSSRISTPAGLPLGAQTPAETALAIHAEIITKSRVEQIPTREAEAIVPTVSSSEAIDPICGMTVRVTDASLTATANGRQAFFCGSGCRDAWPATTTEESR